jgi:amino acid adenylation domain-containing protein
MPHIVCDGWSLSVFFRELADLYEAFSKNLSSPLQELPLQYSDYAAWQKEWLENNAMDSHVNYWQQQLKGHPRNLNLPTDFSRPSSQNYRGACESISLPKILTEKIKTFASQEGATLFMTLLAAFQTLLFRYTGQENIVVGSPIASRNHPETQDMIGCFVNTLALRTDLSRSPGFRQLLARVKKITLDAYAHQDLPLQKVVENVRDDGDLTLSPLFQVLFVLQNTPDVVQEFSGLTFRSVSIDNKTAKYDVSLILEEYPEGLRGKLEYSTDLFKVHTIKRLIGHFQTLLENIMHDPDRPVSQLTLLTETEWHQLVVEWNDTKAEYRGDKCIHELFEEQVKRSPDWAAVIYEDQQLTYRELNEKANQLAHYLRKQGVGPEVLVGICIERSLEMVIGILGILKAGGAYVPLDPAYPKDRLAFMLEDAGLSLLLTKKYLCEKLPERTLRTILLDNERDTVDHESKDNFQSGACGDNLAYIIYTSGSTGKPKGVLSEHRGLSKVSEAQHQIFQVRPGDRVLQFASMSFDASIFEIVMALGGATLCMVRRESIFPGPDLFRFLRDLSITIATLPPSALAPLPYEELPDLRILTVAGEVCRGELAGRWGRGRRFFNLYGLTETAIWTTVAEYKDNGSHFSIGRPISNTRTYILDQHMNPVPVGHRGELYIGGDGLARGYINQGKLTTEKFIPDPFSQEPGARLYRSGDLARYLPDGNIEFLGRIDDQVNIRGFRIEPGEIESVLRQQAGVKEAVVIAREDQPGDKRLTAYVVLEKKSAITAREMRMFLREKLPDYMVPSAFVELSSLPLAPNGKVERHALFPPPVSQVEPEDAPVHTSQPFEEEVRKIWQDILQKDHIGVNDDFFELGGHSLLVTQVIAWMRRDLQVEVTVHDFFEFPSVAAIAKVVARQKGIM